VRTCFSFWLNNVHPSIFRYYVVTNAGRRERDLAWFAARLDEWNAGEQGKAGKVEMTVLKEWGLLALQGMSRTLSFLQFRFIVPSLVFLLLPLTVLMC
jgi:hypothetical protein